MSERPIIMSAESVRAILAGRKAQTRRVVKRGFLPDGSVDLACCPYGVPGDRLWVKETYRHGGEWDDTTPGDADPLYGANQVRYEADGMAHDLSPSGIGKPWACAVDDGWGKKRSPLFMPRWASRLTLEVTAVRVERLHDISEEDARAEGVEMLTATQACSNDEDPSWSRRDRFAGGWDWLNGKRGFPWSSNPWVWVVEFTRIDAALRDGDDAGKEER